MSLPRYSEYKSSGVKWLGKVPSHWAVARLKNALLVKITDGPHTTPVFTDQGVPFLSVDGIQNGELTFDSCRHISIDDHIEFSKKAFPRKDDLLMGKAASTGKIARVKVDFEFSIWSPLALIRIEKKKFLPEFVEFVLKSPLAQAEIDVLCTSNTQKNISMDDIPKLTMPRPSILEQELIVKFLTHETEKIDALIAEQVKLIELLTEKRQAVISRAVTKGLDSSAKMKDSGVDWLGEVPEHWDVKKIRYLLKEKNGLIRGPFGGDLKKEIFVSNGIKVLEQKNAIYQDLKLGDSYIDMAKFEEMRRFEVFSEDFIMSCSGTIGRTYRVPANAPKAIINQALMIMRFNESITNDYLEWIFIADFFQRQILDNSQGGAMKNLVGMDIFTGIALPRPPIEEQRKISNELKTKIQKFDELLAESHSGIECLQERRSALISAAVTGQIDVRNAVNQSEAA